MRAPKWEDADKQWDTYNAFHIKRHKFVQFDTGEVICTCMRARPCERGIGKSVGVNNVAFFKPADNFDFMKRMYTIAGERVLKTWLTDETLLFDSGTDRIVNVQWSHNSCDRDMLEHIPLRFQQTCTVYFGGDNLPPRSGHKVRYSKPRAWTLEQKRMIAHNMKIIRVAAKATGASGYYLSPISADELANDEIKLSDYDDTVIAATALKGASRVRDVFEEPYLIVKPKTET